MLQLRPLPSDMVEIGVAVVLAQVNEEGSGSTVQIRGGVQLELHCVACLDAVDEAGLLAMRQSASPGVQATSKSRHYYGWKCL